MSSNAPVVAPRRPHTLVERFANKFAVDPDKLVDTLKATCFKQKDAQVTDQQMVALLIVADQYGLNPFTKEVFAFPDKQGGIVPVISVDGWARIINDAPNFDGVEFVMGPYTRADDDSKDCPEWIECVIYRKDREHATRVREYLDETYRPAFGGTNRDGKRYSVPGPWQSHTKRMLRHKALIQGARLAFGFAGIYDEDEANRIIEGQVVTEGGEVVSEVASLNQRLAAPKPVVEPEEKPEPKKAPAKKAKAKAEKKAPEKAPEQREMPAVAGATGEKGIAVLTCEAEISSAKTIDALNAALELVRELDDDDERARLRKLGAEVAKGLRPA
jgi:phage recombination protein Bet